MNVTELAALVTLYFFVIVLALLRTARKTRSRFDSELCWHRDVLLKELRTELLVQANRIESGIRKP